MTTLSYALPDEASHPDEADNLVIPGPTAVVATTRNRHRRLPYALFGLSGFLKQFMNARLLFLNGQKGTGKTLFATALGYHLLRHAYVVNAAFNFPVSFGGAPGYNQTFGGIDEAGIFFDARFSYRDKDVSSFIAEATTYLRKRGSFLVVPSYNSPDKRLRDGLRMYRYRVIPRLRLWFYLWELGPEGKENRIPRVNYFTGRLILFNPHYFYGCYDTFYEPPLEVTVRWLQDFLNRPVHIPDYVDF